MANVFSSASGSILFKKHVLNKLSYIKYFLLVILLKFVIVVLQVPLRNKVAEHFNVDVLKDALRYETLEYFALSLKNLQKIIFIFNRKMTKEISGCIYFI